MVKNRAKVRPARAVVGQYVPLVVFGQLVPIFRTVPRAAPILVCFRVVAGLARQAKVSPVVGAAQVAADDVIDRRLNPLQLAVAPLQRLNRLYARRRNPLVGFRLTLFRFRRLLIASLALT